MVDKNIEYKGTELESRDNKKEVRDKIISFIVVALISSTLFVLADVFFKVVIWRSYFVQINALVFTILFGIIIYTLMLAISKKASRATKICYGFVFLISIINQIKIIYTDEPLYLADINFLSKSFDLLHLVSENIDPTSLYRFFIICIIYAFVLEIISFVHWKYNVEIKDVKKRIAIIVVDVILLMLLFFPNSYMKNLYLKLFFNTDNYVDFNSYVTNLEFYERSSFISGMYGVALNSRFVEPENYDENILKAMLNEVTEIETEKIGKPNIIVLFSESFWDIDQLSEVEFDKPVTSNFNKLKEQGEFINLISPTYGGMSENVAFEFVTGGSMNYFPRGYIPVMSLYSRKNASNMSSLVKVLNNNGYRSEIVFAKDFYNSEKAYLKIGFHDYEEIIPAGYTSVTDKYCTDLIIKRLERKSDQPLFYLLGTIESHMPFPKDKYKEYDVSIVRSKLSQTMNDTLRSYAQGLYNADEQLGRLYEYIKTYDEPTILVFLGDHLPYIYTSENKNVIFELDYFNTEDSVLNDFRQYNTQALVLSNFDMENVNIPDYLGTDMLLTYIVNQLDIENEPYYEWLYKTCDILAGSNRIISLDKNGNLYPTNELTGKMKKAYDDKELMQYKFFINAPK